MRRLPGLSGLNEFSREFSRGRLAPVAMASVLAAAFAFHGVAELPAARAKIVRFPQTFTSSMDIPVEPTRTTGALVTPFAAIWHARNDTASPARFQLLLNGRPVCEQEIEPGSARRVDCAVTDPDWRGDAPHVLTVTGPDRAALEYAELASHHGGTGGVHRLAIVPRGARMSRTPPLIALGVWAALLALYLFVPPAPLGRPLAAVYRAAAAIILTLCAVALAAPLATPFEVLVAPSTWMQWVGFASAPRIAALLTSFIVALRDPDRRRAAVVVLALVHCRLGGGGGCRGRSPTRSPGELQRIHPHRAREIRQPPAAA